MAADDFSARAHSRRHFLGAGLAAAGGLVLAGAFGADAADALDTKTFFPLVLSSDLYASPRPQRLVFALSHSSSSGIQYASGPSVQVRFGSPDGTTTTTLMKTAYDRAGLPKGRGVYVSFPTFPTAGIWKVEARAKGQKIPFSVQVNASPITVVPGQPAPRAPSPTPTATLGVKPICTRDPMCPLHTKSLSDVIGAGKPVAALFATPARCQSQYCGPVLDELLDVMDAYTDKVTFVHTEIYQSSTGTALVPTLNAWKIESEPFLFGVDGAGVIQSRIDGAFGGDEMKALLDALVQTQPSG
jgi:hypothetical protein